jgi:hypothetical protein
VDLNGRYRTYKSFAEQVRVLTSKPSHELIIFPVIEWVPHCSSGKNKAGDVLSPRRRSPVIVSEVNKVTRSPIWVHLSAIRRGEKPSTSSQKATIVFGVPVLDIMAEDSHEREESVKPLDVIYGVLVRFGLRRTSA